jgi:predicted ATPase
LTANGDRFFVLTGGPGSGKSTLLAALGRSGCQHLPEAGRGIIQDQQTIAGWGLPWSDPILFAELMLSWDMRSYHSAEQLSGPVFFDRSVIDVIGYLRLVGLPTPSHLEKAARAFRYHRRVFILPPWLDIYERDHERKQDFQEAIRTYEAMVAVYPEYGYQLIEVPCASVEKRMQFLLEIAGITPGR